MDNHGSNGQTVRNLLKTASKQISRSLADAPEGFADTPYLDAIVLLCDAAGLTREQLLAMMGDSVSPKTVAQFSALVRNRCSGNPVSYVRGKKEFYGREFSVNEHVLVPRPETEHLVEHALVIADRRISQTPTHLHDCCTGSGAVAISVAAERPQITVTASDISPEALTIANANASKLLSDPSHVSFFESDLLSGLDSLVTCGTLPCPDIITANPPYIAQEEYAKLREADWPEPELALVAGSDGLDLIARLVAEASRLLAPRGYLITEVGAEQGPATRSLFHEAGFVDIEVVRDLAGKDRICAGRFDG